MANIFSPMIHALRSGLWRVSQEEKAYSSIALMVGVGGILAVTVVNIAQKNSHTTNNAKLEDQRAAGHEENLSAFCRAKNLFAADQTGLALLYPRPYINYNNAGATSFSGRAGVTTGTGWSIDQNNLTLQMVDSRTLNNATLASVMSGVVPTGNQWKNVSLKYLNKTSKSATPYAIEAVVVEASSQVGDKLYSDRAELAIAPPPQPSCSLTSSVANGIVLETPVTVTVSMNCMHVLLSAQLNQLTPTVATFPAVPNVIKTQFNAVSENLTLKPTVSNAFSTVGTYSVNGSYTGVGADASGKAAYVPGTTPATSFVIQNPPVCQLVASATTATEPATITVDMTCNGATSYRDINGSTTIPIVLSGPNTYTIVGNYKGTASNARSFQTPPLTIRIDPAPEPNCWLTAAPATTVTSPATIAVDMACDRPISFRDLNGTWGLPVTFGQVGQVTVWGRYKGVYGSSALRQTAAIVLNIQAPPPPPPSDICQTAIGSRYYDSPQAVIDAYRARGGRLNIQTCMACGFGSGIRNRCCYAQLLNRNGC